MENLPNCPKCNSEYTYEDGSLLVCPECAYEWSPEASNEEENVIKDVDTVVKGSKSMHTPSFSFFKNIHICLFIWLYQVSVGTCGI